jgi:hypothetical protein
MILSLRPAPLDVFPVVALVKMRQAAEELEALFNFFARQRD